MEAMGTEPRKVLLVHPDDVNLADVKALAAQHDYDVRAGYFCPRGQVLVVELGPLIPAPEPEFQIRTDLP